MSALSGPLLLAAWAFVLAAALLAAFSWQALSVELAKVLCWLAVGLAAAGLRLPLVMHLPAASPVLAALQPWLFCAALGSAGVHAVLAYCDPQLPMNVDRRWPPSRHSGLPA